MTEEGTDGGARILRTLRSFGPINMDDFDDRLRTQKLAYLIQEVGGSDGPFVYQWYIRGPYSSALTQEIFSCEEGGGQPGAAALSGDERALAQRVRSLVGDRVDDPLELELYASVWYLTPTRRLSESDRISIRESMRRTKPHFDERQVREALDRIETFRVENGLAPRSGAG